MASKHVRKPSGRAPLPRRNTRGPLDADDPLSPAITPLSSLVRTSTASPALTIPLVTESVSLPPTLAPQALQEEAQTPGAPIITKDLSFLLDKAIYHPLSQLNVATPFRRPLCVLPATVGSLAQALMQLENVLSTLDFLSAAHLAATTLTSNLLQPTDSETIFRLLGIRYSCLELTGNTMLAAQEAKALEDITSAFYYTDPSPSKSEDGNTPFMTPIPQHIMPFSLRIQALRLESIGFSDPRREITALYDLGLECREHLSSTLTSPEDSLIWRNHLDEVGIRVVNALIEVDVECALRTLRSMEPTKDSNTPTWLFRMALLNLRIGDVQSAHTLTNRLDQAGTATSFAALLAIAEGRYEDAIAALEKQKSVEDRHFSALVQQNLAVAYLYTGNVQKAREILQNLVAGGDSFHSLTSNLATVLELISDKSRDLKLALAGEVAARHKSDNRMRPMSNADFKL